MRFVEAARGGPFREVPTIEITEGPLVDPRPPDVAADWWLLQLFGIAPLDVTAEEFLALRGPTLGRCCPPFDPSAVQVVVQDDPVLTAAIIVHELTHVWDLQAHPAMLERSPPELIEGSAVLVEAAYLESVGRQVTEVRPEWRTDIPAELHRAWNWAGFRYAGGYEFLSSLPEGRTVDEVFAAPPTSTEQIMFVDAYLAGDEPAAISPRPSPRRGTLVRWHPFGADLLALAIEPAAGPAAAEQLAAQWAGGDLALARDGEERCATGLVIMDTADAAQRVSGALTTAAPLLTAVADDRTVNVEGCLPA